MQLEIPLRIKDNKAHNDPVIKTLDFYLSTPSIEIRDQTFRAGQRKEIDVRLSTTYPDEYSKEDQSKYKEAFETAVKKGVNVELLKAKLATIYNNQNKDVASKGKDSPFYNELSRTYELLGTIEMISSELSPYENCLSLGTEVQLLKISTKNFINLGLLKKS